MILKVGDKIKIQPFEEQAEVYSFAQEGTRVTLGVIFKPSMQAKKFVLSQEEFLKRIHRLPCLGEDLISQALPRDPFLLFAEALRTRLAHAFDPHYAVSITQVDLLPLLRSPSLWRSGKPPPIAVASLAMELP